RCRSLEPHRARRHAHGLGPSGRRPLSGTDGRLRQATRSAREGIHGAHQAVPVLGCLPSTHETDRTGMEGTCPRVRYWPNCELRNSRGTACGPSGENAVARLRKIPDAEFEKGRYESGWNGRQILAHIASIEWTYPRLLDVARKALVPKPAETQKEKTTDPPQRAARGGIDDYNARQVEKRAQMTVTELIAEFEANRATTVAAIEAADEALFSTTIGGAGGNNT